VLRSFSRFPRHVSPAGAAASFVVAVASFGLLPIVNWNRRFRNHARYERRQLWHLAEWLRLQTGRADAARLVAMTDLARWPRPSTAAVLVATAVAATGLIWAVWNDPLVFRAVWDAVAGQRSLAELSRRGGAGLAGVIVWSAGLFVAYALHGWQVRRQGAAVRQFVRGLNPVLIEEGVDPVIVLPTGAGIGLGWLVAALVGVAGGMIWMLPAMLAGGAHRRYTSVTCPSLRLSIGGRVRGLLALRRPPVWVPRFADPEMRCPEPKCGSPMAPVAAFCPRCGTCAATRRIDGARSGEPARRSEKAGGCEDR
jgi:hypothetical protein